MGVSCGDKLAGGNRGGSSKIKLAQRKFKSTLPRISLLLLLVFFI